MPNDKVYKIAFSDIDGTLLNAERAPSVMLRSEVARLTANNTPFILISSRMPRAMTWIQDAMGITGSPLVCYNGGLVLVDDEVVHSEVIPLHIIRTLWDFQRGTGLSVQLFHGEEWYVESMDFYAKREENNTRVTPSVRQLQATITDWKVRNIGAHKIMVMGKPEEIDVLVGQLSRVFGKDLHLYRSKDTYLEIANKNISKLTGIRRVLEQKYPEFELADCVAFGDNYNDLEMLKGVGLGVAVANARPEVLAVADLVAATAKEDGVALTLRRLFTGD